MRDSTCYGGFVLRVGLELFGVFCEEGEGSFDVVLPLFAGEAVDEGVDYGVEGY